MREFIVTRFFQLVVTMFIVSLLVFLMMRLRGDPISIMAPAYLQSKNRSRHCAPPGALTNRFWNNTSSSCAKLSPGISALRFFARRPAMEVVIERLGNSWLLAA